MKRKNKKTILFLVIAILMNCVFNPILVKMTAAEEVIQPRTPYNIIEGYDVVFCIDNSKSVWSQQTIRDEALRSIVNLAVGSDIRIGGVYFADRVCKSQSLTSMENKEGSMKIFQEFFDMTEQDPNNIDTNIGNALKEALSLFGEQDVSRQKIVILFSDGINENKAEDKAYKEAADALMKEQAAILEEKNIPLYCVYLQKERNDEDTLKKLVNYFNDDNSYTEERFKKVTESEINLLSQQFAKTFYAMQNNMKYRELSFDTSGNASFYVPEVGVKKLQIYLHNEAPFEAKLSYEGSAEIDGDSWGDGNSIYISAKNPKSGYWNISITGDSVPATTGTIAYYSDLSASAKLVPTDGNSDGIYKNKEVRTEVHFYDSENKEIQIDPAAEVSGSLVMTGSDQEKTRQKLSLAASEKGMVSDSFTIERYGDYKFSIKVVYEDFVNLAFSLPGGSIQGNAPQTYPQTGRMGFYPCEEGFYKEFLEEELFSDPEQETVKVIGVDQKNQENPIEVVQKKGIVRVIAGKKGEISCSLLLEDSSGMTSEVNISGSIYNKKIWNVIINLLKVVFALFVVGMIIFIIKNRTDSIIHKRQKNRLKEEYSELNKHIKENVQKEERMIERFEKAQDKMNMEYHGYGDDIDKLEELCEKLEPYQIELFHADVFLGENSINSKYESAKELGKKIQKLGTEVKESLDGLPEILDAAVNVEELQNNISNYKNKNKVILKNLEELTCLIGQYEKIVNEIRREAVKIRRISRDIQEMLDTPVECTLRMEISGLQGIKICKDHGKILRGYYSLDEKLLFYSSGDYISLKKLLQNQETQILVYGYTDCEGNKGLRLESPVSFTVQPHSPELEKTTGNTAILYKGEKYTLMQKSIRVAAVSVE